MLRAQTIPPPPPSSAGALAVIEVCLEACELQRVHDLPKGDDATPTIPPMKHGTKFAP